MHVNVIRSEYRCPVKTCCGYVSDISDLDIGIFERAVYGCGHCGTTWLNKISLLHDITNIVNLFPYRKAVYCFFNDEILPMELDHEPSNYEDLVMAEWE